MLSNGTAESNTLEMKLRAAGNRPSGFDYLRILLSVAILGFHSCITSYGIAADHIFWDGPARPFFRLLLPMFFALSGFLVAGSLQRSKTLVTFLGLRLIRIYPALAVEAILSAVVIGPFLSTYPVRDYFGDARFRSYLWNIIGDVHYKLPGVFEANPFPDKVNGQLWTIPYELGCYAALAVLFFFIARRVHLIVPLSAAALVLLFMIFKTAASGGTLPDYSTPLPGPLLIVSFLAGTGLYLYKDVVPHSRGLFLATTVLSVLALGIVPYGTYLAPFLAAYVTVYLGLLNPPRLRLLSGADYSYGIFLYSFGVQQVVSGLWPWSRQWWLNILICLPLTIAVAALSWHVIEKPALKLRFHLYNLEAWLVRPRGGLFAAVRRHSDDADASASSLQRPAA